MSEYEKTPEQRLEQCLYDEDVAGVIKAIEKGADVKECRIASNTALHLAFEADSLSAKEMMMLVRELVLAGADISAINDEGMMPIHIACKHMIDDKYSDCVEYLLEEGADANARSYAQFTPLYFACDDMSNIKTIKALLEAGADACARTLEGLTPMHQAALNVSNAWKILVDYGANVHEKSEDGTTPLDIIGSYQSLEAAREVEAYWEKVKAQKEVQMLKRDLKTNKEEGFGL